MKKFTSTILLAFVLINFFSCKKEDVSGKLQGVWETQWDDKLEDKAGSIDVKDILIFKNENDAGFSGKFVQIFYGNAMLDAAGSVPYSLMIEGSWKVENSNNVIMNYNIGKMEFTVGKSDKVADYSEAGLAMLADKFDGSLSDALKIKDNDNISDHAESLAESQVVKFFKDRFHKINKDKKGLMNVTIEGNMMNCKVNSGAFGSKLTFDRISDDIEYKGAAKGGKKNEVKVESLAERKARHSSSDDSSLPNYDWLSSRYVTYDDIAGVSGSRLRIMRNYIFAKHGYKFKSKDLQQYFAQYSWYTPLYSDVYNSLSSVEKHNVDFIKSYE